MRRLSAYVSSSSLLRPILTGSYCLSPTEGKDLMAFLREDRSGSSRGWKLTKPIRPPCLHALDCFRRGSPTVLPSYFLFRNLPCYEDWFVIALAAQIGIPMAYRYERQGALVHSIVPCPFRSSEPSTFGSAIPLGLHTEMAFHFLRPQFVGILCCESKGTTVTTVVSGYDLFQRCLEWPDRSTLLAALHEPHFQLHPPVSYHSPTEWKGSWGPLYLGRGYGFRIASHCTMSFRTPMAEMAYQRLLHAMPCVEIPIRLQPGEMLWIHNDRVLHGRGIIPNTDQHRRLKRIYVGNRLLLRSQRNGQTSPREEDIVILQDVSLPSSAVVPFAMITQ